MTLQEKLAMLHGPYAEDPDHPKPQGAIGSAGYIPGIPRLGIPALQESDAGLGITDSDNIRPGDTAVALPSGLAMAASFDPGAAYRAGALLGREAAQRGLNVVLGGGADLVRDPRGGRQFEYAGEDPLLAGIMVGATIRGTQDQHVISTTKHFAVNDQETGRLVLSADLSEQALRESDLLAFEIAIEQGHPGAVMCAYNRVNSVYACENPDLLTTVLKRDWKYPGWVMSDWGAVHSVAAINAGLDQESGEQFDAKVFFGAPLSQALAAGQVKLSRVDDAVLRILRSMAAAGLLDHKAPPKPDVAGDVQTALQIAASGIVLLKNRDLLPLPRTLRRVCVIGGEADAGVPAGGGSSQVTPIGGFARQLASQSKTDKSLFFTPVFDPPSPLSRIKSKLPGATILFSDGHDPAKSAAIARQCDTAIVFARNFSGEGVDLPNLSLPSGQDALIAAVAAANARTVVVLETSGAVTMPWLSQAAAVLEAWYPGSGGADAIADVLFGDVAPSGRLPVTFPAAEADLPNPALPGATVPPNQPFTVHYPEGADAGYKYFARRGIKPLFPFGFGLSTTRFAISNLRVTGGHDLHVTFDVRNIGPRAGTDVPQLYLTARGDQPTRRLLGWHRTTLQPGETQHVSITADPRLLADFDTKTDTWQVPAARIAVAVQEDANNSGPSGSALMQGRHIKP
jgi:beta-glucosidase